MSTTITRQQQRQSAEEWLHQLGNVPLHRIRMWPSPGTATEDDAIRETESGHPCELVNGTLVEKPMGTPESFLASILIASLWPIVRRSQLGMVCATDGMFRMLRGNIREPNVSFTRRDRLPNPMPQVGGWCPDLCIEILSPDNTLAEMQLKRAEYFASGCRMVWEIDPRTQTARCYTNDDEGIAITMLDGGEVLPGFSLPLAELFAEYEAALLPNP